MSPGCRRLLPSKSDTFRLALTGAYRPLTDIQAVVPRKILAPSSDICVSNIKCILTAQKNERRGRFLELAADDATTTPRNAFCKQVWNCLTSSGSQILQSRRSRSAPALESNAVPVVARQARGYHRGAPRGARSGTSLAKHGGFSSRHPSPAPKCSEATPRSSCPSLQGVSACSTTGPRDRCNFSNDLVRTP